MGRIMIAAVLCLALTGCAGTGPLAPATLPPSTQIVAPSSAVPAPVTRFSGIWVGTWGGGLDGKLAVQTIDPDGTAQVLYAWGDHPEGRFTAGSTGARGRIVGDVLTLAPFRNGARISYAIRPDGALDGAYDLDGTITRGVFQKR